MKYIMAIHPKQGGIPWYDAMEIYGIGLVFDDHWVAYNIDLQLGIINVYDSMSRTNDCSALCDEFANLSTYLPLALSKAVKFDGRFERLAPFDRMSVVPRFDVHVPQQRNGVDCGIMAVKFLECFATDNSVTIINPDDTADYRRNFCAQLYNSKDFTVTGGNLGLWVSLV